MPPDSTDQSRTIEYTVRFSGDQWDHGQLRSIIYEHGGVIENEENVLQSEEVDHSFEVGDYALDGREPTPSPEANTVEIVELVDARANEFETEEGKLVSEYKHNRFYPNDDPVVAGVYPNMSSDEVWHFPESRLHR